MNYCQEDNTVKIRYNGPIGNHLVSSPMRKFSTYGMRTRGDVFCVHFEDQEAAPSVFVLFEEPEPEPEPEPAPENVDDESVETGEIGPDDVDDTIVEPAASSEPQSKKRRK